MTWPSWFKRTGVMVRHKKTGAVGEIVYRHDNGKGDVEVDLNGTIVCWFGENYEHAAPQQGKEP